jgi:hypothetical protein
VTRKILLNFIWNSLERILDIVNATQFPSRIFDLVKAGYQSDPMHVGLLCGGLLLFAMLETNRAGWTSSIPTGRDKPRSS